MVENRSLVPDENTRRLQLERAFKRLTQTQRTVDQIFRAEVGDDRHCKIYNNAPNACQEEEKGFVRK